MYRIIGILGPSGCGKDSLLAEIRNHAKEYGDNINEIVMTTTRPPRDYEKNGEHYWFINKDEFNKSNDLVGHTWFNNWGYAIDIKSLQEDKINLAVLNPKMAYELMYEDNIKITLYYLKVNDRERLLRQLTRETNPNCSEICRRFLADKDDDILYSNFQLCCLTNETLKDKQHNAKVILETARTLALADQNCK